MTNAIPLCDATACVQAGCTATVCRGLGIPSNQSFFERSSRAIPGGVNSSIRAFKAVGGTPYIVSRASGAYVYDVEGNELIDLVQSYGAIILGHAHPKVTEAIRSAAGDGTSYGAPTPREMKLAEAIAERVPSCERVRFMNSGTEATSTAVRLARGATGRKRIVTFHGNFHGATDALLAAGGSCIATLGLPGTAGVPEEAVANTWVLPYNVVPTLDEDVAAVFVEPVAANMGLVAPAPGFLEGLRAECDRVGALLVFDEVITGFRLGTSGAQGKYDVRPDLTCFGKVIGGGLPVGAFGGRADVMDFLAPLGPVYQAGTLSGNPLAMAAGLAQLRELEKPSGFARLEELGAHFENGLRGVMQARGIAHRINRVGSMFCLFFTDREILNVSDVMKQDLDLFKKFFWGCLEKGIYLAPSPYETGFLSLAHTEADLDETLGVFDEVLAKI